MIHKEIKQTGGIIWVPFLILLVLNIQAQDATEIVRKSDEKMQGTTSYAEMEMTLLRPAWSRTIAFKSWAMGRDYSMTLITAPPKESGQSFLKLKKDMWSWNPSINRTIKLPPSMMSQGWMGSDYSNDDILKESSIVIDYEHKMSGEETISGLLCYKITLIPKETAAVVWGKIILWISKAEYYQMKADYYDEEDNLVKTHTSSDIRRLNDRSLPTRFEIIPADKPNQKTIVVIKSAQFNIPMKESFFFF